MVRDWMRLSIRFFDLSVTLVGWRTSGVENNEHIVLWNWELSDLLLIFIKLMLKSRIKKQNLSTIFSFSKSGVKYFELKSAMAILGRLLMHPQIKFFFFGRLTSIKVDSRLLSKEILRSCHFTYESYVEISTAMGSLSFTITKSIAW